jgi:hypothetical protein
MAVDMVLLLVGSGLDFSTELRNNRVPAPVVSSDNSRADKETANVAAKAISHERSAKRNDPAS